MDFARYPDTLRMTRHDGILTITINNPHQKNAIVESIDAALPHAFIDADRDPETRVVVITGAPEGGAFCAGGDIGAMQAGLDDIASFVQAYRNGKRILQSMVDCEKPIIAKVNGDAIGLGATLALFADITVAAEHASIADPHVRVGLAAGDGGAIIWPSHAGLAAAKYFLLTGDRVSAREAQAMGLIAKVTTAEALDGEVARLAGKLAAGASQAIGFTKHVLNAGLRQLLASAVDAGFALEAVSSRHPDHREACAAFMENRKPRFAR